MNGSYKEIKSNGSLAKRKFLTPINLQSAVGFTNLPHNVSNLTLPTGLHPCACTLE